MSIELDGEDNLKCPHCEFVFDESVIDMKSKDGEERENADEEYCPECGQAFLIIKYDECYVVEAAEDEEEDNDDYEEDD